LGVKPLYYFCDKENFIFASEIKAIIKNPDIKREINKKSLSEYFIYRYIPSPNTIFQDIFKIPPAHYFEIDKDFNISHKKYFELKIDNQKTKKKQA
jgi:asparagine synthase (glutamine-hydrolysing)